MTAPTNDTEGMNVRLAVRDTAFNTGALLCQEAEVLERQAFQKRREAEEYFALARVSDQFRKAE